MNTYLSHLLKKWLINFIISFMMIILGVFSYKTNLVFDYTNNNKNSLSLATITMLEQIKTPVLISSYTVKNTLQTQIKKLIKPYQYHNSLINLEFIDPSLDPAKIRQLGIQVEGELVIQFMNKTEHLSEISEQKVSNTLLKLSKQSLKTVYFITGHGERSFVNKANFDLSSLSAILKHQGYHIKQADILNLAKQIKTNDILVLAGPQSQIFDGEVDILIHLLDQGIHFLWLSDPHPKSLNSPLNSNLNALSSLSEYLGFEFSDGIIVDPATQQLKLKRPDFAIISEYLRQHPLAAKLKQTTLFPQALAIDPLAQDNDFILKPFLLTSAESWLETSPLLDSIDFNNNQDIAGPLILAITLQRDMEIEGLDDSLHQQRIAIIGDGDFISNRYLANGGNTALGLNIFNWLSAEEQLLAIPPKFYNNQKINLTRTELILLGLFFLICLPLILLLLGIFISYKRK